MAKKDLTDAVAARLAANWLSTPILDLNDDMQTPDIGGWVQLQFPVSSENRKANLHGRFREDGAFRIVVSTEIKSGLASSMTACETIAAIFRDVSFSGVQCWVPSIREGVDDGAYFVASVVVPYTYHYTA